MADKPADEPSEMLCFMNPDTSFDTRDPFDPNRIAERQALRTNNAPLGKSISLGVAGTDPTPALGIWIIGPAVATGLLGLFGPSAIAVLFGGYLATILVGGIIWAKRNPN